MKYIPIKVCKIHYSPKMRLTRNRDVQPLIVFIRGLTKEGKTVDVELINTVPRFWVKCDVNPMEKIPEKNRECIIDIKKDGINIYEEPVWCIYVKYPFDVPTIRSCFPEDDRHQDNIVYEDAVRTFYNIKDTIEVPYECAFDDVQMTPGQIRQPQENYHIEYIDWMFDIETGDSEEFGNPENPVTPVRNLNFTNMKTGDHYQFITKPVNKSKIKKYLGNKGWLMKHLSLDENFSVDKLETIKRDKIHIYCPEKEEDEKWLFREVRKFLRRMKPARLGEHAGYDVAYMLARAAEINLKFRINWDQIQVFDTMACYARFIEGAVTVRGRAALDWMGKRELGYGKIMRPSIDEMYYNNPELLVNYNLWDCVVPTRVCEKSKMMHLFSAVTDYAGTSLRNFDQTQNIVMMTLIYRLNQKNIYLPTFRKTGGEKKMKGGFVMESPTGIYEKLIELDFSKEYPSIIRYLELCFTTRLRDMCSYCKKENCGLREDGRKFIVPGCEMEETIPVIKVGEPANIVFRQDRKGILPEIMEELAVQRDEIRAKMKEVEKKEGKYTPQWMIYYLDQFTRKEIMNSFFGVISRFFPEYGDAITLVARKHLAWNKEKIEERDWDLMEICGRKGKITFKVKSQDTDSCKCIIINLQEIEKDGELTYEQYMTIGDYVCDYLNSTYGEFCRINFGKAEHCFDVKVEDIYKLYMSWGVKKRYAFTTWQGTLFVKGVEIRRSDTPIITRKVQEKFFEDVLGGRFNQTGDFQPKSMKEIKEWLLNVIEEIYDGKRDEELGRPIGINKVENETQQVRAARYSNKYLGTQHRIPGSKVFLYEHTGVKDSSYPKDTPVALEWGDKPSDYGVKLDYDKIIDKHIKRKLEGPLTALGLTMSELLTGMRTEKMSEEGF